MITSISISLITDWSLVSYNLTEYLYFYKMKAFKISCRKVKMYISPRGGNFRFSARGETYVYLKKISPRGEFHLACLYHACGLACSGLWFSGFRGFVSMSVLLRLMVLASFSDTLLVVSVLDIVYDMIAICGHFCSPEGVINSSCGNYGSFLTWG